MNAVEKDDFSNALGQVLKFYNKDLDKMQFSFWYNAFAGKPVHEIKRALMQYTREGKFAPKPKDIIEIMETDKSYTQAHLPAPDVMTTSCPPEIAKAWMWFINRCAKGSANLDGLFDDSGNIDLLTQERYLHIVNHEAREQDSPESIPKEYRLVEVWG